MRRYLVPESFLIRLLLLEADATFRATALAENGVFIDDLFPDFLGMVLDVVGVPEDEEEDDDEGEAKPTEPVVALLNPPEPVRQPFRRRFGEILGADFSPERAGEYLDWCVAEATARNARN